MWLVSKDRYAFAFSNSAAKPFRRQKAVSISVMATKTLIGERLRFWMDVDMPFAPKAARKP